MKYEDQLQELDQQAHELEIARAQAPTYEEVESAKALITHREQELEEAVRALRVIAVKKACLFGWEPIANDFGVKPRLLHKWHKEYCPEVEDLITRAQANERKREAIQTKLDKELEAKKEAVKKLEDFKARLNQEQTDNTNLYY